VPHFTHTDEDDYGDEVTAVNQLHRLRSLDAVLDFQPVAPFVKPRKEEGKATVQGANHTSSTAHVPPRYKNRFGWELHHITIRIFASRESLAKSGVTVHERARFLFNSGMLLDTLSFPFC
jgi:hypothetical protein